jgi:hypothetical protein
MLSNADAAAGKVYLIRIVYTPPTLNAQDAIDRLKALFRQDRYSQRKRHNRESPLAKTNVRDNSHQH